MWQQRMLIIEHFFLLLFSNSHVTSVRQMVIKKKNIFIDNNVNLCTAFMDIIGFDSDNCCEFVQIKKNHVHTRIKKNRHQCVLIKKIEQGGKKYNTGTLESFWKFINICHNIETTDCVYALLKVSISFFHPHSTVNINITHFKFEFINKSLQLY